ncbi:MAG: hypothetical protein ACXU7Z_08095 [Burkholderiaceae bacterium]
MLSQFIFFGSRAKSQRFKEIMLDLLLNPLALIFDMRMGPQGIQFVLFRALVIATVRYENIEFVEFQKNPFRPWSAYRVVNRWVSQRFVIYKKSSWFSKYVVVSPAKSVDFETRLREQGVIVKS